MYKLKVGQGNFETSEIRGTQSKNQREFPSIPRDRIHRCQVKQDVPLSLVGK